MSSIAWPAWPSLDPFFLFPESRRGCSRTALMMPSRRCCQEIDARFRASTSYSAGRASTKMVYSMWLSSDSLSCCMHLSGKILDSTHLLERVAPNANFKLLRRRERWDLAPVVQGPHHQRRVSHACLGEVHLSMQYPRIPLALGGRRQEIPRQFVHVDSFADKLPSDKRRGFRVYFPYGNVMRWIRHEGRQKPTHLT